MLIQRKPPAIEDLSRSLQARIARAFAARRRSGLFRRNAANVPSIPATAIPLTSASAVPRSATPALTSPKCPPALRTTLI